MKSAGGAKKGIAEKLKSYVVQALVRFVDKFYDQTGQFLNRDRP